MTDKPDGPPDLPSDFKRLLNSIRSQRPRTVIQHILEHGYVTTEELRDLYGYNHPPRAARDVREHGIPLVTFRVTGSDGRRIGAYKFGDPAAVQSDKIGGRTTIPKQFKNRLIEETGHHCAICLETYESRHLQVDHRIPYEIAGDVVSQDRATQDYMLLCGSCNRAKSWTCEHCPNWTEQQSPAICAVCYWAHPENHEHIATEAVRRVDITWTGAEIDTFEALKQQATVNEASLKNYIKAVLANHIHRKRSGDY